MKISLLWLVIAAVAISLLFFSDKIRTKEITDMDFVVAALVDVRNPEEYQGISLPNAYNFSLQTLNQDIQRLVKVVGEKNRKIIIYCKIGKQCRYAVKVLTKNGFTNVINMGTKINYPL